MASIATRTGDTGFTGLLYGQRVPKDHPQIEAIGNIDELNSAIGFAKAATPSASRKADLELIQKDLVSLMGEVVCAPEDFERYASSKFQKVAEPDLARIDALIAGIEAKNVRFDGWATPGANMHAASLDLARSIARRAERRLHALPQLGKTIRPLLFQYINRVSDLLWLLAREAENEAPVT